ncbi:MAG: class I SAM-dependent methyltransferase [Acidimicrobiia bacterium]
MSDNFDFTDMEWSGFIEATADIEPTAFHAFAMPLVGSDGDGRQAIDLGFGGGRDTRVFLANGWSVYATDVTPEAAQILLSRVDPDQRDRLTIEIGRFHEVNLPMADLVYASYSLPFAAGDFEASVDAALAAVRPGGWFAGVFFGVNDEWISPEVAAVTREWIGARFAGWESIRIDEFDDDGEFGMEGDTKHWHWYFVAAQRPRS